MAVTTSVTPGNYQVTTSQATESTNQVPGNATTPASSAPASSSDTDSSTDSNANSNNGRLGHLLKGMIALISCVVTLATLLVAVRMWYGCTRWPCCGGG